MASFQLKSIRVPKSSDVLADELRKKILGKDFGPGVALPAERELVSQTGLSRGSVREALRILEAEGLVSTRPGRQGGSFARKPSDDSLARYVSTFVHGRGISFATLLQTREAIEPSLAFLAAVNRTDAELLRLVTVTERVEGAIDDTETFLAENVLWHCALAEASHNELLTAFMVSISNMVYQVSAVENFATEEVCSLVLKAHRRILNAIVAGDGEAARRRMARHLSAVTERMAAFSNASLIID